MGNKEQEETKELDDLEGVNQHKHYIEKNTNGHQFASYNQAENNLSLSEYLKQQLVGLDISEREDFLSKYIIDSLGEDGLLGLDLTTIQNDLLINNDLDVGMLELEGVLGIVQNFEPFGVAAKSLQECLRHLAVSTPSSRRNWPCPATANRTTEGESDDNS